MDDTLDMEEDEELEDEADAEVDKILFDLTNGKLGQAGTVQNEPPVSLLFMSLHGVCVTSVSSHSKTSSKTKRRKELWSNTDNSSAVFSADLIRLLLDFTFTCVRSLGTVCTIPLIISPILDH